MGDGRATEMTCRYLRPESAQLVLSPFLLRTRSGLGRRTASGCRAVGTGPGGHCPPSRCRVGAGAPGQNQNSAWKGQ